MNEFQQAFLAMTKEAMYAKNPLIISLDSSKNNFKSFCSLATKLFYDKQKDKIFIFTYNNDCVDCYDLLNNINSLTSRNKQTLKDYNISIFLDSTLLTGGTESSAPYEDCFFGEMDSNSNDLDESKPIYYLECDLDCLDSNESSLDSNHSKDSNKFYESNKSNKSNFDSSKSHSDSKDLNKSYKSSDSNVKSNLNNNANSKDSNLDSNNPNNNSHSQDSSKSTQTNNKTKIYPTNQTLQIFLNNHKLTILNYSILDSSLNIKLECVSQESNAIKENEINQKKELESNKNDLDLNSTAFLCPILECDELKCIHGGQVKLKSNVGKSIKAKLKDDSIKDSPIMLESDLLYSPILNCPNNIAGIPSPCTQIALILPNARALKKYNDDYPIMQDLCVSGVFSDKGFPIICTKKENTLKIQSTKPSNNNAESKEAIKPNITLTKPQLRLHYKANILQKDNL